MIWLTVAFCLLAVLGSAGFAAVRGWRLWRTFKRTTGRATDALGLVTDAAARAEEHALGLAAGTERMTDAAGRLQRSLAVLAVVRAAAAESRGAFASVRGTVPRK